MEKIEHVASMGESKMHKELLLEDMSGSDHLRYL
jgi:hypothetical protein